MTMMAAMSGGEGRIGGHMKLNTGNLRRAWVLIAAAAFSFSCSNEFTRSAAPVELVVSNTQELQKIDLRPGAPNCDVNVASVLIRAILRNPSEATQQFNDVKITRYRISYVRTDGGTLVPSSFVRSIDLLVPTGGADTSLGSFLAFQSDALTQAPFASLLPQNGGRDPETGRSTVRMDIILDLFGETLAGANVTGRTRIAVDFCYNCGGCA